ncbi:MAG: methanogen output domain 1-containing protein [Haliangiales bacterium]
MSHANSPNVPDDESDRPDSIDRPDRIDVPLDRDRFMRKLLRELSGALEEQIGLEEATGFISVVGLNIGNQLDRDYRAALGVERLSRAQLGSVLVDLKQRIDGDFYIIEQDEDKIVLGNRACPFGEEIADRPSLCMVTSNVLGVIAAESSGYAKIALEETIADGHPGCRVVVHLKPGGDADAAEGSEYYRGTEYNDTP